MGVRRFLQDAWLYSQQCLALFVMPRRLHLLLPRAQSTTSFVWLICVTLRIHLCHVTFWCGTYTHSSLSDTCAMTYWATTHSNVRHVTFYSSPLDLRNYVTCMCMWRCIMTCTRTSTTRKHHERQRAIARETARALERVSAHTRANERGERQINLWVTLALLSISRNPFLNAQQQRQHGLVIHTVKRSIQISPLGPP